jgi:hypothetical protein
LIRENGKNAIAVPSSCERVRRFLPAIFSVRHPRKNVVAARANSAASFVSAKASEGFDALRDGITNALPVRSQAI